VAAKGHGLIVVVLLPETPHAFFNALAGQLLHEPVQETGFIHYNGGLQVHSSLLNVVLHD
jgi:hypothetical protein